MLKKPLFRAIAWGLLLGGFALGVWQLLQFRFAAGDIYPLYSSLRSDPLGVQGLHDALAALPGLTVTRNYKPLEKLRPAGPVTLFYAGVRKDAVWSQAELEAFGLLVTTGSRAVFTFVPEEVPKDTTAEEGDATKGDNASPEEKLQEPSKAKTRAKKDAHSRAGRPKDAGAKDQGPPASRHRADGSQPPDKAEEAPRLRFKKVAAGWGFGFDYLPARPSLAKTQSAALIEAGGHLERELSWHGALCFTDLKPEWRVLYLCDSRPVIITRQYGAGSIVLAADSFFVSNEAMRANRAPQLLARLFSGPRTIVFDEEHHGVREAPGVATLVRKYHLTGVVAGLALLAGLFTWKNASRFLPPHPTATPGEHLIGRGPSEGLLNLLRRSIPRGSLLTVCAAECRKSFTHQPAMLKKLDAALAKHVEIPGRKVDAVAAYREIAVALNSGSARRAETPRNDSIR